MVLPDFVEDVCRIVETYGVSEDDMASWVVSLGSYIEVLNISKSRLSRCIHKLRKQLRKAKKYSKECERISREVATCVKSDISLAVLAAFLALECAIVTALVKDMKEKERKLMRLAEVINHHYYDLVRYRQLLDEYLDRDLRSNEENFHCEFTRGFEECETEDSGTTNANQPEGEDADRDEDGDKKKVEVVCSNEGYCGYEECELVFIYEADDEDEHGEDEDKNKEEDKNEEYKTEDND